MKKILSYCKPLTGFFILSLIIKSAGTIIELVIPYILGMILDEVVPQCTKENLWPMFFWGGVMILCSFLALVMNTVANRRAAYFTKTVIQNVRGDLFDRILSLSAAQTDSFTVPSLVARLSSDSYSLYTMFMDLLRAGIRAPILLIGGVFITLSIEPVLSLSLILPLPFLAMIVFFVSRCSVRLYKRKQKKVDVMVEKIRDTFTGIRVIKALSKTDYEKKSFDRINEDLNRSGQKAGMITGITGPAVSVFMNLGMTAVIVLGAFRVASGHTAPGQIISFMSYFTIILNATLGITRIFTVTTQGSASATRISEVLNTKPDLNLIPASPAEPNAPFLEFRDVTFSYNKTIPTVEHVSFTLEKGQTLGIIGGTGSGKTTLIRLLLRFYDPDQGVILLEGRDLRSFDPARLRKKFGVVFQHDFLMADTLAENIRFARPLPEQALEPAASCAQALPFIQDLKDGFQHPLTTNGSNLSGGQRQRVLISRAVADHPEILILDDASSALDYKTDAALRQSIREEMVGSTCVVVAQRISSIQNADLILVMEHGELIGKGKNDHLMETCPVYREIAESQMGEMQV